MKKIFLICFGLGLFVMSCTFEKAPLPTIDNGGSSGNPSECDTVLYSTDIKAIVDANCISCHGAGYASGDFTTITDLKVDVDNGKLRNRVVVLQDMPQGSSLTTEEIKLIDCWISNGGKP